ncbi:SET domain-containing protein [Xylariales sp. PMI_506]|nr:SET domain-containing protein [Xylariales sp. PMI_506]
MAQSVFNAKTQAFLNWFRALPGATFHPDIQIQDLRDRSAGRGIVATADIPADTVLFTIPRNAIINVLTSELPKKIPHVFEVSTAGLEDADNEADEEGDANGPPDSWISLILVMIYEYLQGDKSLWKPYFDVLPQAFDTPMFWSEEELGELQASAIASKIGKDEADNMFRAKVIPTVQEHADVFYPPGAQRLGEDQLMALAHQMGSTIMAYAFDLENDDQEPDPEDEDEWMEDKDGKIMMGMVPMADILNADAVFNAHVNHEDENLTVTSLKLIPAGAEILNYYGPLSNGELLRRYGYVTLAHSRYDVVELPWDMVLSVLKDQLKLDDQTWGKAINELEDEEIEDVFVIERDLDEPDAKGDVHGEAKLKDLPTDLQQQIALVLKAVRKVDPGSIPDKRKRDEIMANVLHRVLQLRLNQYSTSEAQDHEIGRVGNISERQKTAILVRAGEKRLLQEAIELATERASNIDGPGSAEQPTAKRQRTS